VAKITEAEVTPGPFTVRVTGGGTIDVVGGIGTFSFIIQRASAGELSGQFVGGAAWRDPEGLVVSCFTADGFTRTVSMNGNSSSSIRPPDLRRSQIELRVSEDSQMLIEDLG
jgi:hypothetical protein